MTSDPASSSLCSFLAFGLRLVGAFFGVVFLGVASGSDACLSAVGEEAGFSSLSAFFDGLGGLVSGVASASSS